MADDEKQTEVARSGADWEVVSLTSSAYAAEPNKGETISDSSKTNLNQESSLFGSGHYVFPPSEHENLPVDQNLDETEIKQREQENLPDKEEGGEEEGEEEEEKKEEELGTAHQDESVEKDSQKSSSEIENHEERMESGAEKKREGKEGEDGLEWVKKKGLWLYRHVKEANAVWSVVVAAALVGLVVLGQRWQREKSQHQYQLK